MCSVMQYFQPGPQEPPDSLKFLLRELGENKNMGLL